MFYQRVFVPKAVNRGGNRIVSASKVCGFMIKAFIIGRLGGQQTGSSVAPGGNDRFKNLNIPDSAVDANNACLGA